MLHPLEHVGDHQNPLAHTPALTSCQAPQLCRPRFTAKKVSRHPHPPNDGTLPSITLPHLEITGSQYNSTGHCVVLAGPGSGKTKTLVLKLARILAEDDRAPRGAACITYSQECARELSRRLERLGLREAPNLFVGTVHGFCLRHLLMPYG